MATFNVPQLTSLVDADLDWEDNRGQLVVMARDNPDPLLDLPWQVTAEQLNISDGRWNWDLSGMPLSGRVSLRADNWQQGLEKATLTGRLNVLTHGDAGKGNAVLNIGPGRLSMENSDMPLHLSGEAKQNDLILYAKLPATLTGSVYEPQLAFEPGALLARAGASLTRLISMKSAGRWQV